MAPLNKFIDRISRHRVIGIDSSIFIYSFEEHPQFGALCSAIFELAAVKKIHLVTSAITASEILVKPFEKKNITVINLYEQALAGLFSFSLVSVDYPVAKIAAQIRAEYGVLLPDAIQIAAAIKSGATLFISNDKQVKKIRDIDVLYLKDFAV